MFWFKVAKKIITLLHSKISPSQIAGGIALGIFLGLSVNIWLKLLFFFLILSLKVNISAALLSAGVFALIGYLVDPLADLLGYLVLVQLKFLTPLWTYLYNLPLVPFTKFNNTVVMGSIIISMILFLPVFLSSKKFIIYYRNNQMPKVEKLKVVKLLKASKIYLLYQKIKKTTNITEVLRG